MTISDTINTALSLMYSSRWNFKKREQAFAMLRDIFDDNQLAIIRKAYLSGLPRTHLEILMYPGFSWQQMMVIETELHELPVDKVYRLANPSYDVAQMLLIADGIRSGLTADQINFLTQHKYSLTKMQIILGAFKQGVTLDELEHFFYQGSQYHA
jgi:hypothetical protein